LPLSIHLHDEWTGTRTFRDPGVLYTEQSACVALNFQSMSNIDGSKRLANDRSIHLRWTLRDIKGRTKLLPVSPDDLRILTEMGLVEMRDEVPALTNEGHRMIE
jgi:hypothetical protein